MNICCIVELLAEVPLRTGGDSRAMPFGCVETWLRPSLAWLPRLKSLLLVSIGVIPM